MRFVRGVSIVLLVVAGLLILGLAAAFVIVRTPWGIDKVRTIALKAVNNGINAEVTVKRVSWGVFLQGVNLDTVVLKEKGENGRTIVSADRLQASYDLLDIILGKQIVLDNVRLINPNIRLERLPGDSTWNVERIVKPAQQAAPGDKSLIQLKNVRIEKGVVTILQEFKGSDPGRFIIQDVPGGRATVMRFTDLSAIINSLTLRSPTANGVTVELESLATTGHIFPDSFRLQDARGTLTFEDSILSLNLPQFDLPASRTAMNGAIVFGSGGPVFDLRIDGNTIALRDFRWAVPELPQKGDGKATVRLHTDSARLAVTIEDARFVAPNTQLSGNLQVRLGDTLLIRGVDVHLSPLDLALLKNLVPENVPTDGSVAGRIRADGSLSSIVTNGQLVWNRPGRVATSVQWSGGVGLRGPPTARGLHLDFTNLDLELLALAGVESPVRGIAEGSVDATGRLDTGLDVRGQLRHRAVDGALSEFAGGGRVQSSPAATSFDIDLIAQPLTLRALAAFSPQLDSLRGEARGPVSLRGAPNDLSIEADLETLAGRIFADMRVRGTEQRAFAGTVRVDSFRPERVHPRAPALTARGFATFDLAGTSLADLRGPLQLTLDTTQFGPLALNSARLVSRLGDGLINVDTMFANVLGLILRGTGSFGLIAERMGALTLALDTSTIGTLSPVLFEDGATGSDQKNISGSLLGQATITGNIAGFGAEGRLEMAQILRGEDGVKTGTVQFTATDILKDNARARFEAFGDSVRFAGRLLDSLRIAADYANNRAAVTALGRAGAQDVIRLSSTVTQADNITSIRFEQLRLGDGSEAWVLRDSATVRVASGEAELNAFELLREDSAGRLFARGRIAWDIPDTAYAAARRPLDFQADLERVPLSELLGILQLNGAGRGTVAGRVHVGGTPRAPDIDANLKVDGFGLGEAQLDSLIASVDYVSEKAVLNVQGFSAGQRIVDGTGNIPIDLRFMSTGQRRLAETLDGRFVATSMPASLLLGFVEAFTNVDGMIDGEIFARGTTRDPQLSGSLALSNGAMTWPDMGVRYIGIGGNLDFSNPMNVKVDVYGFSNDPGRGQVRITGIVDMKQATDPAFDLDVQSLGLLAARRRDAEIWVSGNASIGGHYTRPEVTGRITVDRGTLYLDELYRQYLIVPLEDPLLNAVVDTSLVAVKRVLPPSENPFLKNLLIDNATIQVRPGTRLHSREMDVEVTSLPGELTVTYDRRRAEDMRVSGSLIVVRGQYRMDFPPIVRTFQVDSGSVNFTGSMNPNLSISATNLARTPTGPLNIIARVTGTLESPRVNLQSDASPPISESDLYSYLFFGAPTYAFNLGATALGGGSGQGALFGNLGVQSLAATGLASVGSGLQALAQSIGFADYVGLSAAEALPGQAPQSGLSGLLANTQLEFGRYITSDVFVVWSQRIGTPGSTPGVRLEWQFFPTFKLQGFTEDRFARTPSIGLSQSVAARRVFGFSIFREWGY
jgi:hypothetical protein